ncbi:hypothetical protein TIFTF001_037559 [Ficus carica]|uniref:Uncharacterized protein n=1 Tax=Ficus carica TaxID=3494 RepID=A0AA88E5T3_FICCA|nr:hypothetical protein TIFTF001_037559 [Ficus carica]
MKVMMASKLPVSYRPALGRVGLWFELEMDWPPQHHSIVARPVSNLPATVDARWRGVAWQTVKCGDQAAMRFDIL